MSVSTPVTSQATKSQPGDPTCRAMSADTMKMPDPIMDPATIIVESSRPSPWTNFPSVEIETEAVSGIVCPWMS